MTYEIPVEVEAEEDLGIVGDDDDNQHQPIEDLAQSFDVEVDAVEVDSDEIIIPEKSSLVSSDSETSSESEEPVVIITKSKRTRKQSVMVGSVRKGKYSVN